MKCTSKSEPTTPFRYWAGNSVRTTAYISTEGIVSFKIRYKKKAKSEWDTKAHVSSSRHLRLSIIKLYFQACSSIMSLHHPTQSVVLIMETTVKVRIFQHSM
jgi:hypothetical protein